jgi:hypothetical protein
MRQSRRDTGMTARRRVALIGAVAILFQALLVGWHHHPLALPGHGGPAASLYSPTQPLAPSTAEDLCEICAALHHQSASPLAFAAPPMPSSAADAIDLPDRAPIGRAWARGFHARAPPSLLRQAALVDLPS